MRFRKQLLEIIDYAYNQAFDSDICVCPSLVPDWDDSHVTYSMVNRQLRGLRLIRDYVEKQNDDNLFTTELTTSYVPNEDITIVWQYMYIDGEIAQRTLVGWYHGEPEHGISKEYSSMPLTAQYDF